MGSEEITARRILADASQHYVRGPLNPVREAELRDLIAAALREAVAAEREGCAKLCEQISTDEQRLKLVGDSFSGHHAYAEMVTESLAAAIRARSEP